MGARERAEKREGRGARPKLEGSTNCVSGGGSWAGGRTYLGAARVKGGKGGYKAPRGVVDKRGRVSLTGGVYAGGVFFVGGTTGDQGADRRSEQLSWDNPRGETRR